MKESNYTTKETPELRIVRSFNVKPEVVFDAMTNPDDMRVWWTEDTHFDIDLRVGGQWKIARREGDMDLVMSGEYYEIERPHRLVYSIAMPQFSPNSDEVAIDIVSDGKGGCKVTFVQSGPDIAAELRELPDGSTSESEKGWQQGFDLMEKSWEDG